MSEQLMGILEELRPDVDFTKETALTYAVNPETLKKKLI